MVKSIAAYFIVFTPLFFLGKFIHITLVLDNQVSFPLENMYLYHFLFSLGVCTLFTYLAFNGILKDQLGIIYLITLTLKFLFFAGIFKELILSKNSLPRLDRVSMLVPLIIFLAVEVVFISKTLKKI